MVGQAPAAWVALRASIEVINWDDDYPALVLHDFAVRLNGVLSAKGGAGSTAGADGGGHRSRPMGPIVDGSATRRLTSWPEPPS